MTGPIPRNTWATESGDRYRPETILLVAEDGRTHRYRWNPETRAYDIDLGALEIPAIATEGPDDSE